MKHVLAIALPAVLMLAGCGAEEPKKPAKPAGPNYAKMKSIIEVEKIVPANLKIPYQNLFSCRYETAIKNKEEAPELSPKYAGSVLEAVRKDPAAGDKCNAALHGSPQK